MSLHISRDYECSGLSRQHSSPQMRDEWQVTNTHFWLVNIYIYIASRDTVRRLLSSKAAIERHLLNLGVQNMYGKNVLHYLVVNRDKHNIKLFLNIIEDSGDALNAVDGQGMSPLMQCLVRNQMEEAEKTVLWWGMMGSGMMPPAQLRCHSSARWVSYWCNFGCR